MCYFPHKTRLNVALTPPFVRTERLFFFLKKKEKKKKRMNSLFGRSKSKHRKAGAGSLKDRIGNPTPLDPIKINGSFIDLKSSPQDGRSASQNPSVPQVPQLPVVNEEWKGGGAGQGLAPGDGDDARCHQRHFQTPPPPPPPSPPQPLPQPSRSDSNPRASDFDIGDYFRGAGNSQPVREPTRRNQEE